MKKLMIAAAIVCAAAMSQAATLNWSASALYNYDGENAPAKPDVVNTMSAYLFTASTSEALGLIIDSVAADLAKGDTSSLSDATQMMPNKTTANKIEQTDTGVDVAGGLTFGKIIFLNDVDASKATQFFVSNEISETIDTSLGGTLAFGSQKNVGMNVADNWTAVAVPEPTSGLLLLLGMAGLALRRRRA